MKKLLFVILLLPLLGYSQQNATFKTIKVDTIRFSDTLVFEDNVGTVLFSISNDDLALLQKIKKGEIVTTIVVQLEADNYWDVLLLIMFLTVCAFLLGRYR